MSGQIRIVAIFEAKPGEEAALAAGASLCATHTLKDDGRLEYTPNKDISDAGRIVFIETWASQAALDAHMKTDHFKEFLGVVDRSAKPGWVVHTLEPIA